MPTLQKCQLTYLNRWQKIKSVKFKTIKLKNTLKYLVISAFVFTQHAHASQQYSEGDSAFLKRGEQEGGGQDQARKALQLFREYHSKNPSDPESGWRHSMGCYFFGLHIAKDDDEKLQIFAEGRDAGKSALELAPKCAPCHFWTAINMALYGKHAGIFKMFFSISTIRHHLQETVNIDPGYAGAGAYRLLGLIEQKLPGILGGSNKRAKEYFEKAIRTVPDEPLNHLFLMKLLIEEMDDIEGAKAVAKKGLAVPPPPPDRIESIGSLKELEEFLKKPNL